MNLETRIQNVPLLACTALVLFMQAGFCCLEAGSVPSKNSINVALKNVVDFLVATLCFYVIGYALMWGKPWIPGVAGESVPILRGLTSGESFTFLYQLVFCGTSGLEPGGHAEQDGLPRLRRVPRWSKWWGTRRAGRARGGHRRGRLHQPGTMPSRKAAPSA